MREAAAATAPVGGETPVFVFRRVFVPRAEPPGAMKDPVYVRVAFLEAVEEVLSGHWALVSGASGAEVVPGLVAELAATLLVENGAKMVGLTPERLAASVWSFVPTTCRTGRLSEREWASQICQAKPLAGAGGLELHRAFVGRVASAVPSYGEMTFHVRRGTMEDLVLGIGPRGLTLCDPDDRTAPLSMIPHARVRKVTPFPESFALEVWRDASASESERMSFISAQSRAIARLVWDASVHYG